MSAGIQPPNDSGFRLDKVSVYYGSELAVGEVSMAIAEHRITTFIGPSGAGKTTLLRALNRMNDLVPEIRTEGLIEYRGQDLYGATVDLIGIRRRIGMVFQKPNVFPKSIYDNIAYGPRLHDRTGELDELVRRCLERAGLWQEVKSQLSKPAMELSVGQQQRLTIARCLAVNSEALLMDEPSASLDPVATHAIEELMAQLAIDHTIVLVTHNLQQALRVSNDVAFFEAEHCGQEERHGHLVEYGSADQVFADPQDERTKVYLASS
ncbi:MAG: phosphate ABC transporter ATP-binding protein [Actinomycetota bacterium]|nr:phosphate ABC transporter ATP-binding protein [Actinomycetota bacterium]